MREVNVDPTVSVTTEVELFVEHHHPEDETVEMQRLEQTGSDPDDARLAPAGWARQVYECPRCAQRVTVRLLTKTVADVDVSVTIDGVDVELVDAPG